MLGAVDAAQRLLLAEQATSVSDLLVERIVGEVDRVEHHTHRPVHPPRGDGGRRRVDRRDGGQERLQVLDVGAALRRCHGELRVGQLQIALEHPDLAAEQADATGWQSGHEPPQPAEEGQVQVAVAVGDDHLEHLPLARVLDDSGLHARQDGRDIVHL